MDSTEIKKCIICNEEGEEVANLPNFPITELFFDKEKDIELPTTSENQALIYCNNCSHMFLKNHLSKDFIYSNYFLESSQSGSAQLSSNNFYEFIKQNSNIKSGTVIDIGANDTFLLKKFNNDTFKRVGIDPNIKSEDTSIICVSDYFENCNIANIASNEKLIVCSHTLEHVYDVHSFLDSIEKNINPSDEVFFQFPSLDLLIKDARFDQINHQHLNYFSLFSVQKILEMHGLSIVKHFFDHNHYGTLMCFVKKIGTKNTNNAQCNKYLTNKSINVAYEIFNKNIESANIRLRSLQGNFYSFGASLTIPVLCYFVPEILNCKSIIDSDNNKERMRFVNVPLEIEHDSKIDFSINNFLISAVSSKSTARKIFNLLLKREALNIIVPLNII